MDGIAPFTSGLSNNSFFPNTIQRSSDRASAMRRESMDFTIYTVEGDKVTLSAKSQTEIQSNTYSWLAREKNGIQAGREQQDLSKLAGNFSVTIEGDLNQDEAADLNKAFGTINKMISDFLGGNKDQAIADMKDFANYQTVSGVDADLQYEVQASATTHSNQPMGLPPPPDALMPQADSSVTLLDKILSELKKTQISTAKLINPLKDLFNLLMAKHTAANPADTKGPQTLADIQAGLNKQLQGANSQPSSSPDASAAASTPAPSAPRTPINIAA